MNFNFTQKGWECPKCGRVYSPWVSSCRNCGNHKIVSVPGTGTDPYSQSQTYDATRIYKNKVIKTYKPEDIFEVFKCKNCAYNPKIHGVRKNFCRLFGSHISPEDFCANFEKDDSDDE